MSFQTVAWNETQVAMLTRMWGDGDSASTIASAIGDGATRSAIIGKVHRLKLPTRKTRAAPTWGGPRVSSKPRRPRTPRSPHVAGNGEAIRAARQRASQPDMEPVEPISTNASDLLIPIGQRKSLLELNAFTCKFPVGHVGEGLFFCGALPVPDHPYCRAHWARTHARQP